MKIASHDKYGLEQQGDMVKLGIVQEMDKPGSKVVEQMSEGCPMLLAGLKSLLEPGEPLTRTTLAGRNVTVGPGSPATVS